MKLKMYFLIAFPFTSMYLRYARVDKTRVDRWQGIRCKTA